MNSTQQIRNRTIELCDAVIKWARDRNFYMPSSGATKLTQKCKYYEEVGELILAINKHRDGDAIDAIGDILVTYIVTHGYDCLEGRVSNTGVCNLIAFLTGDARQFNGVRSLMRKYGSDDISMQRKALFLGMMTSIECDGFNEIAWLGYLNAIAQTYGVSLQDALLHSYNTIKDRKGKLINGSFIKEEDLRIKHQEQLAAPMQAPEDEE